MQSSQLTQPEAAGLLTGALLGGVGIACAEFEFFAGAIDQGMIGYVECDHGPHHHRFDYLEPIAVAHRDEERFFYRCLRSSCRVMATAPPVASHDHRFDLLSPPVTFEARSLRECGEPGCGLLGEP
ncbi:MAG: hypothetical protein EXQ71_06035 [Acidimicrobiia bacterium]|nr:hypothetical protein [Acidimicrobiia bacterium]